MECFLYDHRENILPSSYQIARSHISPLLHRIFNVLTRSTYWVRCLENLIFSTLSFSKRHVCDMNRNNLLFIPSQLLCAIPGSLCEQNERRKKGIFMLTLWRTKKKVLYFNTICRWKKILTRKCDDIKMEKNQRER